MCAPKYDLMPFPHIYTGLKEDCRVRRHHPHTILQTLHTQGFLKIAAGEIMRWTHGETKLYIKLSLTLLIMHLACELFVILAWKIQPDNLHSTRYVSSYVEVNL